MAKAPIIIPVEEPNEKYFDDLYRAQRTVAAQIPHLRREWDGLNDDMSFATGTINEDPSETQTQFGPECDINTILERYKAGGELPQRQIKYGETIDYSMGLTEAMDAVHDVTDAYRQTVPPELQTVYPTWREWLNATANGSYEHELAKLAEKKHLAEEDAKALAEIKERRVTQKLQSDLQKLSEPTPVKVTEPLPGEKMETKK